MSQNKTTNNQPLFAKEGGNIVFQKGPSSTNVDGIPLSIYKHTESDMHVMLCSIPCSLFTVHIFVPSISHDNKGHSHCLEHMIFCGSKRYPDRGYLHSIANCNLANGTNGWADVDHVRYSVTAASEEALANILPVYLDHILNPLLKDEQFVSEVYHFDQTGKEQGVVFSEMLDRENDQVNLLYHTKDRLMYAPGSPYTFATGGLTRSIAELTNAEIIDYHRKFYDSNNITMVITGPLSDQFVLNVLQAIPREIIQSRGSNSRIPITAALPDMQPDEGFKYMSYPSDDIDTGSIVFSWHGPDVDDVETIIALDALLIFLAKNPSSPLKQRFVERPIPLAVDFTTGVISRIPTNICIAFNGVPCHKDNDSNEQDPDLPHLFDKFYLQNLLIQELHRVLDTKFGGDVLAMAKTCQEMSNSMISNMENNPDDMIKDALREVIVARHFSEKDVDSTAMISANARRFDIYHDLSQRPIEYWLDLLSKWLCENTIYCVAAIPNVELGSNLETERKETEKKNAASIIDKEAHNRKIEQAIKASEVKIPSHIQQLMPMADITKTTILPHKHVLQPATSAYPIGPVSAYQIVHQDTNFVSMTIGIPLAQMSDELRPFMVLFQHLALNSDIVLPKGTEYNIGEGGGCKHISYTEVSDQLATLTTHIYAAVGLANEKFFCTMLDEFYILSADIVEDQFKQAIRWLFQAFMFADYTPERILTAAQNLLSEIGYWKQEGDDILYMVNDYLTTKEQHASKPRWMNQHINIFEQENVLKYVVEQTKGGNVKPIADKLNTIKLFLYSTTDGGFLSLGVPKNKNSDIYIETLSKEWNACLAAVEHNCSAPKVGNRWPFPVQLKTRFHDLAKPMRVHVPISSLQASHLYMSIECNLYRAPDLTSSLSFYEQLAKLPAIDYYALDLLIDLLKPFDGPLYAAIRGRGYAYGAFFINRFWDDKLCFKSCQVTNVPKTILAMQQLVKDIGQNWDEYVTEFGINMAKSIGTYENVNSRDSSSSLLAACANANYLGFKSLKQAELWRSTHLAAVTNQDLRRVYDQYLSKLGDPSYLIFTTLVTPLGTEIPAELGPFETRTSDSFVVPYSG